jgi:hypothetical protein
MPPGLVRFDAEPCVRRIIIFRCPRDFGFGVFSSPDVYSPQGRTGRAQGASCGSTIGF